MPARKEIDFKAATKTLNEYKEIIMLDKQVLRTHEIEVLWDNSGLPKVNNLIGWLVKKKIVERVNKGRYRLPIEPIYYKKIEAIISESRNEAKMRQRNLITRRVEAEMSAQTQAVLDIEKFTDDELFAEIKRRGYTGIFSKSPIKVI